MLCETATNPGSSGPDVSLLKRAGWSYELKLDGVRILAHKDGATVRLVYRSGIDASAAYPEITEAVAALPVGQAVVDGEIVAFDAAGKPSFERLQQRIGMGRKRVGRQQVPVAYVVFDVLTLDGRDVMSQPLRERRVLLAGIVTNQGVVRTLDHLQGDGRPLFAMCRSQGLEGVIAKRDDSPYAPGQRTPDWIKIKAERSEELVVVGWTRGAGGGIGAIDLASYEDGRLVTRGKVGSGIGESASRALQKRFSALVVPACAAEGPLEPAALGRTFVRPEVVVSVRFHSWTEDGRLRQPVYRGVRDDISPDECTARPADAIDARDDDVAKYYETIAPVLAPYVGAKSSRAVLDRVAAGERTFDLECVPYAAFLARDADSARSLRALLERLGLVAFAKVGALGIEVVVPAGKTASADATRALADLVARLVPGVTALARVVAPYSLLAADARRVSAPLAWDELDHEPRAHTTRTVGERVASRGDLMSGLLETRVSLARAVAHVEQILRSR